MHLAADRSRHPARVPAGLGGVDRGNQWDIEEFGQRDGRVGDQPVVCVHDIRTPRLGSPAGGPQRQPGPSHRVAHRQRPRHHVRAEVELVWVMCGGDHPHALGDLVGRGMRAGVGVRGATAEHHDSRARPRPAPSPTGRRAVRARRPPPAGTPTTPSEFSRSLDPARACAKCRQFTACRCADTLARGAGRGHERRSLRASSAPNRPSARFQPAASRSACSRRPDASAPAISRVACACRCAR